MDLTEIWVVLAALAGLLLFTALILWATRGDDEAPP